MIPEQIGRYEIREQLGQGGMAVVYRAYDPRFKREVALKLLPQEFLHNPTFQTRFEREAQTIAALEHPAILPVYDVGEQDGQPYLVMSLMTGGSLVERVQQRSPMPLDEAAAIIAPLADGLDEVHAQGIVHRDFKPANVLFDQYGHPYLSDFGIARMIEGTAALTGGGIIGTPAYMAPEMARTGNVSPLVDVYALAATLFQMLTGKLPYRADTPMGILVAATQQPIPNIRSFRPDLPEALQEIIERGMAKSPAARYPSAGALARDLNAVLATGQADPQARVTLELPLDSREDAPTVERRRAVPLLWIGGAALVAALALAGILGSGLLSQENQAQQSAEAAPTPSENPLPAGETPAETPTEPPAVTETTTITETAPPTETPTPTITPTPAPPRVPITRDNLDQIVIVDTLELEQMGDTAAWSSDGNYLLSGSAMWDVARRQPQWLNANGFEWRTGVWHTTLPQVAVARDFVVLLDASTGNEIQSLAGLTDIAEAICVTPDGAQVLAVGYDGRIVRWDSGSGDVLETNNTLYDSLDHETQTDFGNLAESIERTTFNPDCSFLAIAVSVFPPLTRDHRLVLLDVNQGVLKEFGGQFYSDLAFSPDGSQLAAEVHYGPIQIYDMQTQQLQHTWTHPGTSLQMGGVGFSPDGTILVTTGRGTNNWANPAIVFWDMETGQILRSISYNDLAPTLGAEPLGYHPTPTTVAWSPDGAMIAILADPERGLMLLWGLPETP
jgi:serine/threonine protein kinase